MCTRRERESGSSSISAAIADTTDSKDRFPKVREGWGPKKLQEMGQELLAANQKAPLRPSQPSALEERIDAFIA